MEGTSSRRDIGLGGSGDSVNLTLYQLHIEDEGESRSTSTLFCFLPDSSNRRNCRFHKRGFPVISLSQGRV